MATQGGQGLAWSSLLGMLSTKEKERNRKCSVRLLDTIFVGSEQSGGGRGLQWFFTTKSGTLSRKKTSGATLEGITDRFSRFALSNPNNTDRTIGVFVQANGQRQLLSESTLEELLAPSSSSRLSQPGAFLQVYLRPYRGQDTIVSCRATRSGNNGALSYSFSKRSGAGASAAEAMGPSSLSEQMSRFVEEIESFLQEAKGCVLQSAALDFVVDDNEHVWLCNVTECIASGADEGGPREKDKLKDREKEKENQAVAGKGNNSGSSLLPALPNASLGEGRPSSGSRAVRSDTPRGSVLGSGEMLSRVGEAYCCPFGPDDLPGLRAWSLISLAENGENEHRWAIEMDEYKPGMLLSPDPAVEAMRRQRAEARHKVPMLQALVLRFADRILLGREPLANEEVFQKAWQACFHQAKGLASDQRSEVVACGNTHAICRKLELLCKINFVGSEKPLELPPDRPQSESSAVGSSRGSATGLVGGFGDEEAEEEFSRRVHSAAERNKPPRGADDSIKARGLVGGVRALHLHQAFVEPSSQADSFFNSDMEVVPEPAPKQQQQQQQQQAQPNKAGAGSVAGKRGDAAAGKRGAGGKKKGGAGAAGSGFRRDAGPMEEPPSIDLIAKFAAEKEKQQRLMRQQQIDTQRQVAAAQLSELEDGGADPYYLDDAQPDYDEGGVEGWNGARNRRGPASKKGKSGGKKGAAGLQRGGMLEDEERLARLERMASLPNQLSFLQQQQQQQQWISAEAFNPTGSFAGSVVSNSESDFMARHAQHGDTGMLGGVDAMDSLLSNGSLVGVADKLDPALRDRVKQLERQVQQLSAAGERKDGEIDKLLERLKKSNSDLDHARKWSQGELQRLKDEHEMDVIRLREQHAKQMAAIAIAPEPQVNFDGSTSSSPSKQASDAFQANRQLLEQLETLRSEQRSQLLRFTEERRSLQAEASNRLLSQERQLKSELSEMRAQVTSLEDRVTQYSEEASTAKSKAESLAMTCRQLEMARMEAVEQQSKLRSDLKNMQQSVNASYRLESQQGMTVGVDADTQIRLNEAKSEASRRQLINKVDFLKAQLAAEQANMEEMKEAMAANQKKMDEMREDFRQKAKEMETMKHYAVEEAEKRMEASYESRMAELTTLQTKMMMMQGQLQDAFQDGALLKQREEQAKGAAARANAQQSILRAEIEQLKVQLADVRLELEESQAQAGGKHNNDAMIRRLDNERQYLKSQLASEITHKNEMQNALAQSQHQLNEVQRQWKQDVDALKEQLTNDKHEAVAKEQRLQAANITLEGDIARLETSNRDLKEAFIKCRDQVRMEQLAMENATSVNRRLTEQLETTRLDLQRLKQVEEQSADAHRQQISALKNAMGEAETRKTKEVGKLKEELSTQYLLNSAAQMESMQLRNGFQEERKALQRDAGAGRIVEMLHRWKKNRLAHSLRVWSTNSTLLGVAKQFRGHVNELMKDTLAEERQAKEAALESLTREMLAVQEARVAELNSQFSETLELDRSAWEEAKREELEKLHMEMQQHIEEVEGHWMAEIEASKRDGENAVYRANQQNEIAIGEVEARCQMTIDDNYDEYQRQRAQLQEEARAREVEMATLNQHVAELEAAHRQEIVQLMASHTTATRQAGQEKKEALEALRKEAEQRQAAALQAAQEGFERETERLVGEWRQQQSEQFAAFKDECNATMGVERQQLYEETELRIRDLRTTWTEERDDLLKAKEEEYQAMLNEKVDSHAKFVEVERVRAVKLEASKWRQALKDAEHRFELEVNKARAEGRADREKMAKEQLREQEKEHELVLQQLAEKHQGTITSMEIDHQGELERQQLRFDEQRKDAERKAEAMTKEALDREFGDRMKKAVEEAWEDSAKVWQTKLKKEEERLAQFKRDVATQMQQLANERNELQERVNQSDDMIRRMETMNRTEVDQLKKDYELEREMTALQFKNAKKAALKDLAAEQTATLDAMEEKYKDIAEGRIKKEKDRFEADMKREIAQLQHESEQLITGLEEAVSALKGEKGALSEQLERTAQKLEDTEDALFDLQTEHKKTKMDSYVSMWRTVINVDKMRERFKAGMDQFDVERQEREAQMQKEFQRNMNEMTLAAMKLSGLLQDIEEVRADTQRILVGYRSEELLEKRTQIKVLERDLERLTMERDSLEEQRDLAEEEIESLEGQVRELEDQIRDHNRTSSMQNGRINVAHARKKRRLDTELERVLETIEQKRINVHDIDDKAFEKAKQRDEKEADMVQLEKELVQILVEQQRKVLSNIEVLRGSTDEKTRMICHVARLPYPPLVNPSIVDVEEMLRKDQEDRKKKAEEELEFHKMTNRSSAAPGPGPSSNSSVKKR